MFAEHAGLAACIALFTIAGLSLTIKKLSVTPAAPPQPDPERFDQIHSTAELGSRPLRELSYTVFDTETTGLRPSAGDKIISIGAVRIVDGRLLHDEIFDQLIDPAHPLNPESARIHGITPAMLRGKPLIAQVLPRFHQFCDGTVLVAHNAAFDMRFLQLQETATGVRFTQPVLDTMLLSAVAHPKQRKHSLEAIAARLGVSLVGRHAALGDAIITGEIFLKLLPLLHVRGVITLRDAWEASRQTRYAHIHIHY